MTVRHDQVTTWSGPSRAASLPGNTVALADMLRLRYIAIVAEVAHVPTRVGWTLGRPPAHFRARRLEVCHPRPTQGAAQPRLREHARPRRALGRVLYPQPGRGVSDARPSGGSWPRDGRRARRQEDLHHH